MVYLNVIVPAKYWADQVYTYCAKEPIALGSRVLVPYGKKKLYGIVVGRGEEIPGVKIREILSAEHVPLLSEETLRLWQWLQEHFFMKPYEALRLFLPPGDLSAISLVDGRWTDGATTSLIKRGKEEVPKNLSPVQKRLLGLLEERKEVGLDALLEIHGFQKRTVDTLLKKGLIEEATPKEFPLQDPPFPLHEEQRQAIFRIEGSPRGLHLLHGRTGSGKTEVYFALAKKHLEAGKDVLFMLPEIGITSQMIARVEARFPGRVRILHSALTQSQRRREWLRIREGGPWLVLGVRSSIFAPFKNLGLLIVDEEQEHSYGAGLGQNYDAREVALFIHESRHIPLVFGTATPRIETMYRAKTGEMTLSRLQNRPGDAKPPEVRVVDMRNELAMGNTSMFSEELLFAMEEALGRREQIILFLNRRGYSNFVACRQCGEAVMCPHCDIAMTYHKSIHRLRCHYCGYTEPVPTQCPHCHSDQIKGFGIGTQQVEDALKRIFPSARILRMDRDTVKHREDYLRVAASMERAEVDILVGTQMLAKGFDFPRVSLVGVLAADLSLYKNDFRAEEDTFNLLSQVAGRAGRSHIRGRAVIQTYSPENPAIQCATTENYDAFYLEELAIRENFGYPPFMRFGTVSVTHPDKGMALEEVEWVRRTLVESYEGEDLLLASIAEEPKIKDQFTWTFACKVSANHGDLLRRAWKRVLKEYRLQFPKKELYADLKIQ